MSSVHSSFQLQGVPNLIQDLLGIMYKRVCFNAISGFNIITVILHNKGLS